MILLLVVVGVGLAVWLVGLTVGGIDRCGRWERRHRRHYRGFHRAPTRRAALRRVNAVVGTGGTATGPGSLGRSAADGPLTDS